MLILFHSVCAYVAMIYSFIIFYLVLLDMWAIFLRGLVSQSQLRVVSFLVNYLLIRIKKNSIAMCL